MRNHLPLGYSSQSTSYSAGEAAMNRDCFLIAILNQGAFATKYCHYYCCLQTVELFSLPASEFLLRDLSRHSAKNRFNLTSVASYSCLEVAAFLIVVKRVAIT